MLVAVGLLESVAPQVGALQAVVPPVEGVPLEEVARVYLVRPARPLEVGAERQQAVVEAWPARGAELSAGLQGVEGLRGGRQEDPVSIGVEGPHRLREELAALAVRWVQVCLVGAATETERKTGARESARTTSWKTRRPGQRNATWLPELSTTDR